MISVLTLTYKRHHLLEEAIESFLRQENIKECEMVVINDNPEVKYIYEHPNVKILNLDERFPSISEKIKWGYKQCMHNYVYRLDDDDLLAPLALKMTKEDIDNNPDYEIYRSSGMYFYNNNKFDSICDNINNGNIYTKEYLDRIKFPDKSGDEDADITFHHNGKIFTSKQTPTMIYRWGMNTLHISGLGVQPNSVVLDQADRVLDNRTGIVELNPHFNEDYYGQINKDSK
jgi:hypothetical protein